MQPTAPSAASRLDRLPTSKFHRRLLLLVGGGLFLDNFDIYVAGPVLGILLASKLSTLNENATFISATFLGMLIGTIAAGILADRFGRRFTFQFNLALFGIASIACAACHSMPWITFFRLVAGIGLGAELIVGYSTLSEFTPPERRGRWQALLSLTSSFGLLASTLLSWSLTPLLGWQIMFILPGLGAFFVLWMRKSLPESPRWLEVKGRFAEADHVVSAIEAEVRAEYPDFRPPSAAVRPPVGSIWQRRLIRPLVLGTVLQVVMFTTLYGLVSWIPTFLLKQGMPINQSLGLSALMSLGGPTGALLAFALVDKIGRKNAIIAGSLLAAVVAAAFSQVGSQSMAVVVGFGVFALVYFLLATIQAVYLPELFPTEVRMRCNAVCIGIARLTTLITPFVVVFLFEHYGIAGVVGTIGLLLAMQAAVMSVIGLETSGVSLEGIADLDGSGLARVPSLRLD